MNFEQICSFGAISPVDPSKVNELAESIKNNGWVGCPILVYGEQLLTGSHRLAALKQLADDDYDIICGMDVAEDVTDIVEANIQAYEEENGWVPDIDYSNIGWLLKGSWVEEYKSEIVEW